MQDLIIIGGGIGGLYCYYQIVKNIPDIKILLIEKEQYLGGRIKTIYDRDNHILYETGPWRFQSHHYRLINLLKNLDIKYKKINKVLFQFDKNEKFSNDNLNESFYVERGFNYIIEKLLENTSLENIITNLEIKDIQYKNNVFEIITHNQIFYSKKIIIACPPNIYLQWDIFNHLNEMKNSIHYRTYSKIFGKFNDKITYKGIENFFIYSNIFNQTISSLYDNNWILISFEQDSQKSNKWSSIFDENIENFSEILKKNWIKIFGNNNNTVTDLKFYYFKNGSPCIENNESKIKFRNPLPNLYIVGSYFGSCDDQNFIEDSLTVSDHILEKYFDIKINILKNIEINVNFCSEIRYILDQYPLYSCSANCMANILYILMKYNDYPAFLPSSLYIYYNARSFMGTENENSGTNYLSMFEALNKYGICPETMWPFSEENLLKKPTDECYEFAKNFNFRIEIETINISTKKQNEILKCINNKLLNGSIFLISMNRFKNQYFSKCGYIKYDDDIEKKKNTMDHSLGLLAIDFIKKEVICLNSYGLHRGFFGFNYIPFSIFFNEILTNDSIYEIKFRYIYNICNQKIINCIKETDEIKLSALANLDYFYQVKDYNIYYDHVIIGGGITGCYLANKLKILFPNEKILILDENFNKSTVSNTKYEDTYLPSTFYRFEKKFMTRLNHLIDSYKIKSYKCQLQNVNNHFSKKIINSILEILEAESIDQIMTLKNKIKIFKNEGLCKLTINDVLHDKLKLNKDQVKYLYENLMNVHPEFYNDVSFSIMISIIICELSEEIEWYFINDVLELVNTLVKDFDKIKLGDFVFCNDNFQHCIITNAKCEIENNQCLVHLENSDQKQMSDKININFKELYFATTNKKNIIPRPIIFQKKTRLNLFIQFEFNINEISIRYDEIFGKLILINQNTLMFRLSDSEMYNKINASKPFYVKNGIIYDLECWDFLNTLVKEKFDILKPKKFVIFIYDNQLYTPFPLENSLWDEFLIQLNLNSNIHHLNNNFSTNFYEIEGCLEMVDLFIDLYYL